MSGKVGLWNNSQPTTYSNIEVVTSPEPGTIFLALLGCCFVAFGYKKK